MPRGDEDHSRTVHLLRTPSSNYQFHRSAFTSNDRDSVPKFSHTLTSYNCYP